MSLPGLAEFRQIARRRLAAHEHTTIPGAPGLRRAAVVLCVVEHRGEPAIIVIKRAYRGRNAGQWGLPGGRLDAGETTVQAALRELHEEIGLSVEPGAILGPLDDFPAASGFAITPLVAVPDDPGPLIPSPDEVHSVHHVPLARLAAGDVVHWVPQLDGGKLLQMRLSPAMVVHPPTGAILWQFREIVLLGNEAAGPETRVADFLQPEWTHR